MFARALPALLAAALIATPALAQGRPKPQPIDDPARLVRMGETMAARGQLDQALALFDRALVRDPRNVDALRAAGAAALERGDGVRAFGYFAAWATQARDEPLPLLGMGAALVLRQEPQEALAVLARALDRKAPLAAVARWEGVALDLLGRSQDAQLAFSHALGSAPADTDIIQHFALSLAITGDRAAALQLLGKIEEAPKETVPDIRRTLAMVYALTGDVREASAILAGLPAAERETMTALLVRVPDLGGPDKALVAHLGRLPAALLAAAAASTPASPPPLPAAAAEPGSAPQIWVQLGASGNRAALAGAWARLKAHPRLAGLAPFIQKAPHTNRLLAGPMPTPQAAETVVRALKASGIDAIVARTPKGADISGL
ncbi:MAG: tetratricopeptide repeat protein [Alphaproteobacteria bacterium]|nr:tetratricopeptide repeat protein [Alphaproteobacteria bacterium]